MKVKAYIHSLKDQANDRHVLGEAEIIRRIGDNLYLAEVNGVRCTAIFNPFVGRYFVDDVYGVQTRSYCDWQHPSSAMDELTDDDEGET